MRFLVTGAAGFIGAAVSDALLARGDQVIGLDNFEPYYPVELKQARRQRLSDRHGANFAFTATDLTDANAVESALSGERFERIIHLAAQPGVRYSLENPRAYVQANVLGHLNMLELARHRAVDHFIYASSSSVYGGSDKELFSVDDRVDHPLSLYAATKKSDELMSETYAHLYRLPQTGLRFFTVYGPWGRPDMMVWKFTVRIIAGESIPVYNGGEIWRDYTYIDDIVSGVLVVADHPPADDNSRKPGGSVGPHTIYNIGNNRCEKLTSVIEVLEEACGRKASRNLLPMQPGDVLRTAADLSAITGDLGYHPTTSVAEGIPRFVQWYRAFHNL